MDEIFDPFLTDCLAVRSVLQHFNYKKTFRLNFNPTEK